MLQLFRTNLFLASILLIFYIIILRLFLFITPLSWEPSNQGILAEWIYNLFGKTGTLLSIVSMILILIHAILLNFLVSKYRMAKQITLFAGVFYILFVSFLPEFGTLSPALMANTFFIIALGELFDTYKKYSSAAKIFNVGFSLSVASLFYFPFIYYFFFGFISLGILRSFRIKERLILFIGFIVPYFLLSVYYFWFDRLGTFWQVQFLNNATFFNFDWSLASETIAKISLFLVATLVSAISYRLYHFKKDIQIQKNLDILFLSLFFGGITLFFETDVSVEHLILLTPSLAIFISFNFLELPRSWAETFHLLLFLGALFWQYKMFLPI